MAMIINVAMIVDVEIRASLSLSGLGNQCESAKSADTPLNFRPSFARNIQGRFFG